MQIESRRDHYGGRLAAGSGAEDAGGEGGGGCLPHYSVRQWLRAACSRLPPLPTYLSGTSAIVLDLVSDSKMVIYV